MAKNKKRTRKNNANKPRIKPVCKFYLEGKCNRGDSCTFMHSNESGSPVKSKPDNISSDDGTTVATLALPEGLSVSLSLLTPSQQELARQLCSMDQTHLFESWSTDIKDADINAKKVAMMTKLESVDNTYPGGLASYLSNARSLLEKSKAGVNPLDGWTPSIPAGETFTLGTPEFLSTESLGMKHAGKVGFVLVAGGLGERLGYGDIKIGLPTELATETCYIQFYIETILAFQSRYAKDGVTLPLCIMTSGDTNDKTVELLEKNSNFGMEKDQVTIVQQGMGVPALLDNQARMALDTENPYDIQMKPHGHGDIHSLLYTHGVAKDWFEKKGLEWMVFFQDTNGLAFHTLALSLGVSSKLGLVMNSIACPRKAGQAIGGIAKLTKGDETRTINVEYNQLDPLLRASGSNGDVNDETTGYSPYPGNINQLLFKLEDYVAALDRTKGIMPEFVNPKYADAEKTVFKKPTRLECMMQDFPTILIGPQAEKVGFTSLASEMCFSPVKNATSDGVALQAKGTHPGVAATGEADQSGAMQRLLRSIGCNVKEGSKVKYSGIEVVSGPDIVLKPSFAVNSTECMQKFTNPSAVSISGRSSLVLKGEGLTIESLNLDGALVVECEPGATGIIRKLSVCNKGWVKVPTDESANEVIKMRGYYMDKIETRKIVFKKDGTIEGDYSPYPPVETEKKVVEAEANGGSNGTKIVEKKSQDESKIKVEKATTQKSAVPAVVLQKEQAPVEKKEKVAGPKSHAGSNGKNKVTEARAIPDVGIPRDEVAVDLSRPTSSEEKEKDTLCGGACIIL